MPARAFAAALAAVALLLAAAGTAMAAPTVTIGSFPAQNATSGTFSFAADGPAKRLQCKLDGAPFDDCVSPLTVSGLSVTTHTFSVRAIGLDDSVGAAASYTWTIDVTAPPVPLITGPGDNTLTNFPTPTFSGTAEPFARVPLFDGSTQIGTPLAGADGHWSFTPASPLADGTHLWRVRAIDGAGNRSDYTVLRTLRIDTQPPAAPVVSAPADGARLNFRTPTFAGTIEPQATVAVSEGATRLCSTAGGTSGDWSCISTVSLGDGAHMLSVVARDLAGNESAATTLTIEIDATPPPAPAITAPADGLATPASGVTVSGTAEPMAKVKLYAGPNEIAEEIAAPDGGWSHSFDPLAEGEYAFTAKEIDDFGNLSAPSNVVHVRVDRTAPVVTVSGHPPAQSNQTAADFALTADETAVDFECSLDGADWTACPATPSFGGLAEGAHDFRARGTDAAGNPGVASALFTWTIDLVAPPAPTLDAPADGALLTSARPAISGHAEAGSQVEVLAGSTPVGTAAAAAGTGSWTLTPASALPQGAVQLKARAADAAGNASPFSGVRTVTIDSVAPVTTLQGAPTGATQALTLALAFTSDDPDASFSCSLDSQPFAACASPWTTPALGEGQHTVRVRAKDPAGNVESPPRSASFTVDRTAPAGRSALIAGSAGSDGVPRFSIASDDPGATARCKLDNAAFVACSGSFRPSGAAEGLHALTIRFTDAAGNVGDQVIPFSVTPTPPPPEYYQEPPAATCTVLGAAGIKGGSMRIASATGSGRKLTVKLSAGAAALVRADVTASGRRLATLPAAVRRGSNTLALKLSKQPSAGTRLALAVRFYSVKRQYGTAQLALTASSSGVKRTAGAQSVLDARCPSAGGAKPAARFSVTTAAAGARSFALNSRGRRPLLVQLKVFRSGSNVPAATSVFAVGGGRQSVLVKLGGGARLAKGGYKFTFDAISADGTAASGRGAFLAR